MAATRPEDRSLTVVVPVHDGAAYLSNTLTSLERQDVPVEVVVVDDGSTDDSLELVEGHPTRPVVIRQRNLGVAVARNRGLAEARTRWVSFLDQDDIWLPSRAGILLDLAESTGKPVVATTETAFAREDDRAALTAIGDGRELWPTAWVEAEHELEHLLSAAEPGTGDVELLTADRFMHAPATLTTAFMFERTLAIAAGGCATFVKALDDHVLWLNLARLAGGIPRIDVPGLMYRVHSGSTTTVSPLVAPYLTTLLALRFGRVHPSEPVRADYVDHLLSQLNRAPITRLEQLALLTLSTGRGWRGRSAARWVKRSVKASLAG